MQVSEVRAAGRTLSQVQPGVKSMWDTAEQGAGAPAITRS